MASGDRLTLEQMLKTARRLRSLAHERGRDAFDADGIARLAMMHLIQRLGEAASRLSADFRFDHPEFPWTEMVGLRNRLVHTTIDLDPEIVWRVASEDVEPVIAALERALAD
ncbi:MAG: HepT-like ribonuclease domain-containing protein [Gemmatimonadota bacterium]